MTEKEYVQGRVALIETAVKKNLRIVKATGYPLKSSIYGGSQATTETLLSNDLIISSGPIEGVCEYNCYRLTDSGEAFLAR